MFSPVVPFSGLQGWQFLSRTMSRQRESFSKNEKIINDSNYFKTNISKVNTVDSLIQDRRLLIVALTAFGIQGDIDNKFLIKKVLEGRSSDPESLGNRFSDKRYLNISKAFGFGDFVIPNTSIPDFSDRILEAYTEEMFQVSIGDKDENLRVAMSIKSEIERISSESSNERSKWFMLLANPPLKSAFEGAFRISEGFGALDVDRQVDELISRSSSSFGVYEFDQFLDNDNIDRLRNLFLLSAEISTAVYANSSGVALELLTNRAVVRF